MINLIGIELYKIFRKWRTYIGFIAIGVLVSVIQTAIYMEGNDYLNMMTRGLSQSFMFTGNLMNGYLISQMILGALVIHIPFLITLVAGDLLAGEATNGTYRILMTRPVSRFKVVTSKFIAGIIYANMLVLWLAVLSLGIGILLFGTGELLVIKDSIIIFAQNDILWRFAWAYGFAALSMCLVTSLAFLFSSLVENSIGPIITTMTVIIVFLIVSSIKVSFFEDLAPYLFTSYMNAWRSFFDDPVDTSELVKSAGIMLLHIIGFYGLTLYLFKKKDILS
jgi:ABC-2 type transport system permease protein